MWPAFAYGYEHQFHGPDLKAEVQWQSFFPLSLFNVTESPASGRGGPNFFGVQVRKYV